MNWQEAQHQDEQARQQAALEALRAARKGALTEEQLMILAYECGVANDFYKEIRL